MDDNYPPTLGQNFWLDTPRTDNNLQYPTLPDPFLIFPNSVWLTQLYTKLCNHQYTSNTIPGLSSGTSESAEDM